MSALFDAGCVAAASVDGFSNAAARVPAQPRDGWYDPITLDPWTPADYTLLPVRKK